MKNWDECSGCSRENARQRAARRVFIDNCAFVYAAIPVIALYANTAQQPARSLSQLYCNLATDVFIMPVLTKHFIVRISIQKKSSCWMNNIEDIIHPRDREHSTADDNTSKLNSKWNLSTPVLPTTRGKVSNQNPNLNCHPGDHDMIIREGFKI